MKTHTTAPSDKGFRFPPEMISHAVWLSFRFSLSFRDVEELLVQRGIAVTSETVRQWCLKFGQTYANALRRRRPRCALPRKNRPQRVASLISCRLVSWMLRLHLKGVRHPSHAGDQTRYRRARG